MFVLVYVIFKIFDVEYYQNIPNSDFKDVIELDRFTGNKFSGISDSNNIINSNYTESPKTDCISPTKNNPFMNFVPFTKQTDKKACPVTKEIKEETLKYMNTYPTLQNMYNPNSSLLPFSYLPNPFDTDDKLYDWLYKVPFSCNKGKELTLRGLHGCTMFTHIG